MSINNNNDKESETVESEFSKLNLVTIIHKNCYDPPGKLWCKECVPSCIIEGWTSENSEIDNFIKDTIYNAKYHYNHYDDDYDDDYYDDYDDDYDNDDDYYPIFLEWVQFDRFEDIKQIGESGFAKVFSAKWIDGQANYIKDNGSWKKSEPEPLWNG